MKKIGIIGAGFAGTMTAVHLIEKATSKLDIILVDDQQLLNRGVAYSPYSNQHLLNVIASKMSAYKNSPSHFLDWVISRREFNGIDPNIIANSFLPRRIYGDYLIGIWEGAIELAKEKGININVVKETVRDLDIMPDSVNIILGNIELSVDFCVVANGNNLPRNPSIENMNFYKSPRYFRNPWKLDSVTKVNPEQPVLIIGNGLTMVDTVIGLIENGFRGDIFSLSPNGFNVLPHRHNGLKYSGMDKDLEGKWDLYNLVGILNKHIKLVRKFGISAEPVIDAVRPFTQSIWKSLSITEKQVFISRFRHLWGVARHRIPLHIHDRIQQLRIDGKLQIYSGKLIDISECEDAVKVLFFNKKTDMINEMVVSRVINCTGPETDVMKLDDCFLKRCMERGEINQDVFKLGLSANTDTFQLINANDYVHENLFTMGSNLKGELWESTAVNELRDQAESLANILLRKLPF